MNVLMCSPGYSWLQRMLIRLLIGSLSPTATFSRNHDLHRMRLSATGQHAKLSLSDGGGAGEHRRPLKISAAIGSWS